MWLLRDIYNQCSFKLNPTQSHWPVWHNHAMRNFIHRPRISHPEQTTLCPAVLRHLWEKLRLSLSLKELLFPAPAFHLLPQDYRIIQRINQKGSTRHFIQLIIIWVLTPDKFPSLVLQVIQQQQGAREGWIFQAHLFNSQSENWEPEHTVLGGRETPKCSLGLQSIPKTQLWQSEKLYYAACCVPAIQRWMETAAPQITKHFAIKIMT